MSFRERCLSLALRAYPAEFRRRFGDEMKRSALASMQSARERGVWVVAAAFPYVVAELVAQGLAERLSAVRRLPGEAPLLLDGSGLWRDLGHALRRLVRDPWASLLTVAILAMGLGVATSVFTLVDNILFRPLPYPEPDRLVRVWAGFPEAGASFLDATWTEVEALRQGDPAFDAVAAFSVAPRDLVDEADHPVQIELARLSPGFFEALGARPARGRVFSSRESVEGRPVVVLSHRFWNRRYGGADVLGQTLSIQGETHRIVGIMPPEFDFPHGVTLWRPFTREENQDDDRELQVVARLAPGVDEERASAAAAAMFARVTPVGSSGPITAWVQPLRSMLVRDVDGILLALLGGVGALLLVAVVNVSHLQLLRGLSRRQEIAVRLALGAGRSGVARQLAVECLVLAAAGGLLGLLLGRSLLDWVLASVPHDVPRLAEVGIDLRIVLVMSALTVGIGWLFGLAVARRSAEGAPIQTLRKSRVGDDRSGHRALEGLVALEITLATVLVLTAVLLFTSISRRLDVKPGFEPERLLSLGVSPPPSREGAEERQVFYHQILEEVATVVGVEDVALASVDPVDSGGFPIPLEWLESPAGPAFSARLRSVSPSYFRTVGARFVAGHPFAETSSAESPGVAVVNQAFVRAYLGGDSPLGRRVVHPPYFGNGHPTEHQIVGVVADFLPEASVEPGPWIFVPYRQLPWPRMRLLVRSAGTLAGQAAAVQSRLWSLDPHLAIGQVLPVTGQIEARLAPARFQTHLMTAFSQLALLLAAVGLYATLAVQVAQRRRAIGVRLALGATALSIIWWLVGSGLRMVGTGLALGLALSLLVSRWISSQLFAVSGLELAVWLPTTLALVVAAVAACLPPAWRALRVDPVEELRAD